MIGEGQCDDEVNTPECNYDGGDCCGPNVNCPSYSDCECKDPNAWSLAFLEKPDFFCQPYFLNYYPEKLIFVEF